MSRSLQIINKKPLSKNGKATSKTQRKSILIFTEGETELGYFKEFSIKSRVIGKGHAINTIKEAILVKKSYKNIEEFWIVFDKDENTPSQIIQAIKIAEKANINVAISCEAFELWWLLHYEEVTHYIPRKDYDKKIAKYYPNYLNNKKGVSAGQNMAWKLHPIINVAITNAKKNYNLNNLKKDKYEGSYTTVFKLVEKLLNR
jgi:hypothetical protein